MVSKLTIHVLSLRAVVSVCSPVSALLWRVPGHVAPSWAWPTGRLEGGWRTSKEAPGVSPTIPVCVSDSTPRREDLLRGCPRGLCGSGSFRVTWRVFSTTTTSSLCPGRGGTHLMLRLSGWSYSPSSGISDLRLPV